MIKTFFQPDHRYFHTAVNTAEYMYVIGGTSNYDGVAIQAYSYKCNHWYDIQGKFIQLFLQLFYFASLFWKWSKYYIETTIVMLIQ